MVYQMPTCYCRHCGWTWIPRTVDPKLCPHCKNRMKITVRLPEESPTQSAAHHSQKEGESSVHAGG